MAFCCWETQTGCLLPEPRFAHRRQEPRRQRSACCGGAGSTGPPTHELGARASLYCSVWGDIRPTGSPRHCNPGAHLDCGIFREIKMETRAGWGRGRGFL